MLSILMLISCGNDDTSEDTPEPNPNTIRVIDNTDLFNKTVILYEDDEYLISTYLDKFISSYPFDVLPDYDELKQQAILDAETQDTLHAQNYMKYVNNATYTLAYHLQNGSCLIYNKKSQKIVRTIQMEAYSYGGPMSTTAGRKFYIKKGLLFLETVDLMS